CITAMDADHLDVYGSAEALGSAFRAFAGTIKYNGKLLVRNGLPLRGITYGIDDGADYSAKNIRIGNSAYVFDIATPGETIPDVQFNKPGRHNLLNALAAFAMAAEAGTPGIELAGALATFKGIKRRFSYHIKTDTCIYIDDYAHHPAEIDAVYDAIREMHPGKAVLAVFQPHLFSRTQDFADAFAASLSRFDKIFLLDIYPARELPIAGVSSEWLLSKISNPNKKLVSKATLVREIKQAGAPVILTIGAGDIGEEVEHIKKALSV
ncbi:MAG: UDP-N-acetylmuramate--L-alanine ligase, partial [Sinomicrobium sp.]|nr:UDP-N-acetylmuramate--L-alanine ligase [Sinomicrobium sp.]